MNNPLGHEIGCDCAVCDDIAMREVLKQLNKGGNMSTGKIGILIDPVDDKLRELALATSAWSENDSHGRRSPGLRGAIIMIAQELVALTQLSAKHEDTPK